MTFLSHLTGEFGKSFKRAEAKRNQKVSIKTFIVRKEESDKVITVYVFEIWAEDKHDGISLLTNAVKVVIHVAEEKSGILESGFSSAPTLPDIRGRCQKQNISHQPCIDNFCNPH